jgi:hypothetical protein
LANLTTANWDIPNQNIQLYVSATSTCNSTFLVFNWLYKTINVSYNCKMEIKMVKDSPGCQSQQNDEVEFRPILTFL